MIQYESKIQIVVRKENGTCLIPHDKEQIFPWDISKNTGFGLFLVREILAITGFTVRETLKPGNGARFEIVVPPGLWQNTPSK